MDRQPATFIVRLSPTDIHSWTAVVERVKTGEKFRVADIDAIGKLIARIVEEKGGDEPPQSDR